MGSSQISYSPYSDMLFGPLLPLFFFFSFFFHDHPATQLSDSSFTLISSTLSRTNLTSVDVSFCRDITDNAIVTLAESCPNLKHLNLCGLSRVADRGIQALCSKCWRLESLNLEDVFLFDDSAFWFSPHLDGRPLADENMLKALKTLNLRDCVCVTDYGMKGLAERCRAIESLILRGCEKITDAGLHSMTQTIMERTQHKHPMCETLRHLDLSFCCNVTAVYLSDQLLPLCKGVHEIHLSGINSIDDHFVHLLCECCPSVQTLSLQKCIQITDVSLCWMADFLWLESLDLSGCYRISDSGVDVLTLACTGLQHLHLRRCSKITGVGVTSIGRNLRNLGLLSIDVRDCPRIPHEAVLDLQHNQQLVQVL